MEDWYSVKVATVKDNGGVSILDGYYLSLIDALKSIFPNHTWLPWKFNIPLPKEYWHKTSNQKLFFDSLEEVFRIEKEQDWYQVASFGH